MIFKYTNIDNVILNIPNTDFWDLRFRLFDKDGYDDYGIYLTYKDEEIMIRDHYFWTQGRPNLSCSAVGNLYEEIIDVVIQQIANNPNLSVIDIDSIETQLLNEKYEKIWIDKNYVEIDKNGAW